MFIGLVRWLSASATAATVSVRASAERIPGSHPAPEPPVLSDRDRAGVYTRDMARGSFLFWGG